MSDSHLTAGAVTNEPLAETWNRFWFQPASCRRLTMIRAVFCVITVLYLISSFSDLLFWYGQGGPASTENLAMFVRAAGLESEASWTISPLFTIDAWMGSRIWIYRAYLILAILLCVFVAIGRGGRWCGWILWLLVVGWANRSMMLSGLLESLLSLSLFAVAIGPPSQWTNWKHDHEPERQPRGSDANDSQHWSAGFALRLIAVQFTIVAILTTASMLGGAIWWNGTGAYALAAPIEDRVLDVRDSGLSQIFARPLVYETLTHVIVILLPLGTFLAWIQKSRFMGHALIAAWCLVVAVLGAHLLYATCLFAMSLAIGAKKTRLSREC